MIEIVNESGKKYKLLTDDTIRIIDRERNIHTLYRIEALRDFGKYEKGQCGGYIENENNLSHEGNCWVAYHAKVYDNARVCSNAEVYGNAEVYDNAILSGNARVYSNARVFGNARVYGNASVSGNARVFGNASVYGNAYICSNAKVIGYTNLYGNVIISTDAYITSNLDCITTGQFARFSRTYYKTLDNNIMVTSSNDRRAMPIEEAVEEIKNGEEEISKLYLPIIEAIRDNF